MADSSISVSPIDTIVTTRPSNGAWISLTRDPPQATRRPANRLEIVLTPE
jgi:hypothetical protein